MQKLYALDTNLLLHAPDALYGFDDNIVMLTMTTLEELDQKKKAPGEIGYNARANIRLLKELLQDDEQMPPATKQRTQKLIPHDGNTLVPMKNGGMLYIASECSNTGQAWVIPDGFSRDIPDNRILNETKFIEGQIKHHKKGIQVILVSNDKTMRIKAVLCGIRAESYRNMQVDDEAYTGKREMDVEQSLLDDLSKMGSIVANEYGLPDDFTENEFITFTAGKDTADEAQRLAIYRDGIIKLIQPTPVFGVTPWNSAQAFALYALTAPVSEIPFVILRGEAGTAKTFLSLAAGLAMLNRNQHGNGYDEILISRNNVTSDEAFGYLPGDMESKMAPLLAPFYDNLKSLIKNKYHVDNNEVRTMIQDLIDSETIVATPMAYMRGRCVTGGYLILDEAQNASSRQIQNVVTRAGLRTKIVIIGDPTQIDTPSLSLRNNGLSYAAYTMKGDPLAAQITFSEAESVRSPLASAALRRMK